MPTPVYQPGNMFSDGLRGNNATLGTSSAQSITLTAALLLDGVIEHTVTTAAATDTTDTAANIAAAIGPVNVGDTFTCLLVNTSASSFAITLAAGTNVTIKGSTATVPQNKTALLTFRCTNASTPTYTCYVTISA